MRIVIYSMPLLALTFIGSTWAIGGIERDIKKDNPASPQMAALWEKCRMNTQKKARQSGQNTIVLKPVKPDANSKFLF